MIYDTYIFSITVYVPSIFLVDGKLRYAAANIACTVRG